MTTELTIVIDGKEYRGPAAPGDTLASFLSSRGVAAPPELLRADNGRRIVARYTMVHSLAGSSLSSDLEQPSPVPALTPDDVLISALG